MTGTAPSSHGADLRWLVVGLGNPGPDYHATRHNAGFMVLDLLATRAGGRFTSLKGRADVVEARLDGRRCLLAKPRSFMNLSGGPVVIVRDYFRIPLERLVVVHDDLDLPFGSLRLKRGGGDGGHNGLRSVSQSLGSKEYLRVRVGIGRPPGRMDPADYVLRPFSSAEGKELDLQVDRAADAVELLLAEGLAPAQNRYNDAASSRAATADPDRCQ